ncbi:MAG: flagellar motor protein MotB [Methylophilaceae bacterium]
MAEQPVRPIIVKKIKKVAAGHHGGAWKIAYADFVTAMMAFFLLMWLLGSASKGQLEGIESYFKTPLKVALMGGPSVGASDSILKGGGKDLTRKQMQVKPEDGSKEKEKEPDLKDIQKALEAKEKLQLENLKEKIEKTIDSNETLKKFKKQLLLDITSEGLRIIIVDELNRPMFNSARAELQPYAKKILQEMGKTLNDVPNRISLSGHTDATPFSTGEIAYSNWELSADRANASRRELVAGGMDEFKLMRVVGLSSAALYDKENPFNPINRRISIIVMNRQAEERVIKDESAVKVTKAQDAGNIAASVNAVKGAETDVTFSNEEVAEETPP